MTEALYIGLRRYYADRPPGLEFFSTIQPNLSRFGLTDLEREQRWLENKTF